MRAKFFLLSCLLLLPLWMGCPPRRPQPTIVDTSGRGAPPGGRPLRFGTIDALPPSPEPGFRVANTQQEWGGAPVQVDFATAMLLVASAGLAPTGGHSMTVQSVTEAAGELHVAVVQTAPGLNCPVPQAQEWVGTVVATEKVRLPVRFHVTQTQSQPCLEPPVASMACTVDGTDASGTSLHVPEGATVTCNASASRTDGGRGGPPARGSWALTTSPEGAAPQQIPDAPQTQLRLETPGRYVLQLTVADDQGTEATAEATLHVGGPQQQTTVKLEWAPATEGGATVDLPFTLHVFRSRRDCSPGSRTPPAWCSAETPASPSAPRTVTLPADAAVGRFDIAVDYPSGNRPGEAVAQITVAIDGMTIAEWRDTETREAGFRWEPGAITLPNATIETE